MVDLKKDEVCDEIDKKKSELEQNILIVDLKVILQVHPDQDYGVQGVLKPLIVLLCSRKMTLIHLASFIAHKNGL